MTINQEADAKTTQIATILELGDAATMAQRSDAMLWDTYRRRTVQSRDHLDAALNNPDLRDGEYLLGHTPRSLRPGTDLVILGDAVDSATTPARNNRLLIAIMVLMLAAASVGYPLLIAAVTR